jgi:aryl-alcohol dehydrogenase-like predicted oxidoreductase
MTRLSHLPHTTHLGDLEVCRLGFGAMQLPGPMVWGPPRDPEAARAVLRRVIELGINLIDTAWYYGPRVSHRLIAETLHPYPGDLVLVTKIGCRRTDDKGWVAALRPEDLRMGCEEDLRLLKLDRIDVVHLRWIGQPDVPFREALDAMVALQKEGKIRHIALSNVTPDQVRDAMTRAKIVGVSNLYNVAHGEARLGKLPHVSVEGQEELVDFCAANGLAFLPFFSLAIPGPPRRNEALSRVAMSRGVTEAQVAIAWLLARSPTIVPIPGTGSPAHLEENWAAGTIALTKDEYESISTARSLPE